MPKKRLDNKIALVTGASRGIGAAVAKRYAAEGAHVILVARTSGALEEVDDEIKALGGTATLVPMDLREYDKIDAMGLEVAKRFGKLDILVGNAGVLGGLSPVGHFSPKSWEEVMGVNVTANYRLIRSFDPLLKQSDAGRAIFVTSGWAHMATPYHGAYSASKAALEMLVKIYAEEVRNISNIKANLVDPGVVHTKMLSEAIPGHKAEDYPAPEDITDVFVTLAEASLQETGKIKHNN